MNSQELINGISRVMDTIEIGTPSYLILKEAQEIIKESSVKSKSDEFVMESFKPIIKSYGYKDRYDFRKYMLICEYLSDCNDGYLYKITKRPQEKEEDPYYDYDEEYNTIIVKVSHRLDYSDIEKVWNSVKDNI
jgi:hypothetical protein